MNKKDRRELSRALDLLREGTEIVSDLADRELEKFDNLPESLQLAAQGELLSENSEQLQSGADEFESAISEIEELL